jgi:hypothetical protein
MNRSLDALPTFDLDADLLRTSSRIPSDRSLNPGEADPSTGWSVIEGHRRDEEDDACAAHGGAA